MINLQELKILEQADLQLQFDEGKKLQMLGTDTNLYDLMRCT